jgi:hypothetical protein
MCFGGFRIFSSRSSRHNPRKSKHSTAATVQLPKRSALDNDGIVLGSLNTTPLSGSEFQSALPFPGVDTVETSESGVNSDAKREGLVKKRISHVANDQNSSQEETIIHTVTPRVSSIPVGDDRKEFVLLASRSRTS